MCIWQMKNWCISWSVVVVWAQTLHQLDWLDSSSFGTHLKSLPLSYTSFTSKTSCTQVWAHEMIQCFNLSLTVSTSQRIPFYAIHFYSVSFSLLFSSLRSWERKVFDTPRNKENGVDKNWTDIDEKSIHMYTSHWTNGHILHARLVYPTIVLYLRIRRSSKVYNRMVMTIPMRACEAHVIDGSVFIFDMIT